MTKLDSVHIKLVLLSVISHCFMTNKNSLIKLIIIKIYVILTFIIHTAVKLN